MSRFSDFSTDGGAPWTQGQVLGGHTTRFADRQLGYSVSTLSTAGARSPWR